MKEKELQLEIEELEERIAPSFIFAGGSAPDNAGASPEGVRDDGTFGPSKVGFSSENDGVGADKAGKAAWSSHNNSDVLDNGDT